MESSTQLEERTFEAGLDIILIELEVARREFLRDYAQLIGANDRVIYGSFGRIQK